MNYFVDTLILAFIQGFSEWFPVSSSGHLVLFSKILNYANTVQFDVALHFGTLMAVFVYFGKEIVDIVEDILKMRWKSDRSRMGFIILVSALPAGFIGYFFRDLFQKAFESLWVVAFGFAITSMLLFISSLNYFKNNKKLGYSSAIIIGCAQAFAILPGISRSGATISAGLLQGVSEKEAVKFSFLMSIPVIFGAGVLELGSEKLSPEWILPTFISFIVGLSTIHLLLKIISNSKKNLRWFGAYTLGLALALAGYLLFF